MNSLGDTNNKISYLVSGKSVQISKFFANCFCEADFKSKMILVIDFGLKRINHKRAKAWLGDIIDISRDFYNIESEDIQNDCSELVMDKGEQVRPKIVYLHLNTAYSSWSDELVKEKLELFFEKQILDLVILLHDGKCNSNIFDIFAIVNRHDNVILNMISDDIFIYDADAVMNIMDMFSCRVITKHEHMESCEKISNLVKEISAFEENNSERDKEMFSAEFINNMSFRTAIVDYSGKVVVVAC